MKNIKERRKKRKRKCIEFGKFQRLIDFFYYKKKKFKTEIYEA